MKKEKIKLYTRGALVYWFGIAFIGFAIAILGLVSIIVDFFDGEIVFYVLAGLIALIFPCLSIILIIHAFARKIIIDKMEGNVIVRAGRLDSFKPKKKTLIPLEIIRRVYYRGENAYGGRPDYRNVIVFVIDDEEEIECDGFPQILGTAVSAIRKTEEIVKALDEKVKVWQKEKGIEFATQKSNKK